MASGLLASCSINEPVSTGSFLSDYPEGTLMPTDQTTVAYMQSVVEKADSDGFLSPGDARHLLAQHGYSWDMYVAGDGMGLANWPVGSRCPRQLLRFLDYPVDQLRE